MMKILFQNQPDGNLNQTYSVSFSFKETKANLITGSERIKSKLQQRHPVFMKLFSTF